MTERGQHRQWSQRLKVLCNRKSALICCICGRRFRILNVSDDFIREFLAAVVDTSLSGERVARELDRIAEMRGSPCLMVSDNGTGLASNAILKWQEGRNVDWHYIAPVKPMQNGFVVSFNAPMRDECLCTHEDVSFGAFRVQF